MRSLQTRLVLTLVILTTGILAAVGFTTTFAMNSWLTGRLDTEVVQTLNRATMPMRGGGLPAPPPVDDGGFQPRRGQGVGTLMARLDPTTHRGEVITNSGLTRLSSSALDILEDVPTDGQVHEVDLPRVGSYRVAAAATTMGTVAAGLPSSQTGDVVNSLLTWLVLLTLLGVALAASAGTLLVRRQLAPLREVAATAHEVAALPLSSGAIDLTPRVEDPDERTEVGQVGTALNALLTHVESALEARHRSEQQVRQFVADASHELRTPLATIRGYAELARRTPANTAQALGKVEAQADLMTALVEDLLLLARLDAGRPLASEPVDLTRILLESVSNARVLSPDHHYRLDLPDEALSLTGDEQRLQQVVTNLLTNARTHTPAGTTITVGARAADGRITFWVADDGPGFPPDLAESAFVRFTRGEESRTGGGSGLGLSIVAAIVEAHRGKVNLDSSPGSTRVSVELTGD